MYNPESALIRIAKLESALSRLILECRKSKLIELGGGGMTTEAQLKRSVYLRVEAWPIEEADMVLWEDEEYNG